MNEHRRETGLAANRRFAFGDNWRKFLDRLDEPRVTKAEQSLKELLVRDDLHGLTFLDIGCGSGIFSLAARRLGARVHSIDYDPAAVECALILQQRFYTGDNQWKFGCGSILDADFVGSLGTFDIVYSWGVLHHTGAMYQAIEQAASRVKPGGLFAFALYRKTRFCFFWTHEKRWYANASPWEQRSADALFTFFQRLAFMLRRRDFKQYVANYQSVRGMDYATDVHDWMGGYPYESARPSEVLEFMDRLEFEHIRSNTEPYSTGIFGSGCDEHVYRRGARGA